MNIIKEAIHISGGIKNALLGLLEGAEYTIIAAIIIAFYVMLIVCCIKL